VLKNCQPKIAVFLNAFRPAAPAAAAFGAVNGAAITPQMPAVKPFPPPRVTPAVAGFESRKAKFPGTKIKTASCPCWPSASRAAKTLAQRVASGTGLASGGKIPNHPQNWR